LPKLSHANKRAEGLTRAADAITLNPKRDLAARRFS
jgi:hypothetical protein